MWCFPPTYNKDEVVSDNIEYGDHVEPLLRILPVKLILPTISNVYAGVELFIPSLLFVSSQNNRLSPVIPVPFPYAIYPYVSETLPPPPPLNKTPF